MCLQDFSLRTLYGRQQTFKGLCQHSWQWSLVTSVTPAAESFTDSHLGKSSGSRTRARVAADEDWTLVCMPCTRVGTTLSTTTTACLSSAVLETAAFSPIAAMSRPAPFLPTRVHLSHSFVRRFCSSFSSRYRTRSPVLQTSKGSCLDNQQECNQ